MTLNNRELAALFWIVIIMVFLLKHNNTRNSVKCVLSTLLYKKFIIAYFFSSLFLGLNILFLFISNIWTYNILLPSFKYLILTQIPMSFKAIDYPLNFHITAIKSGIKISLLITLIANLYSFSIFTEILLVPTICGFLLISKLSSEKLTQSIFNFLLVTIYVFIILHSIINIYCNNDYLLLISKIKFLFLTFTLILLDIPFTYILVLYSQYESAFLKINSDSKQKNKIKLSIIRYAKLNLFKISGIIRHSIETRKPCWNTVNDCTNCINEVDIILKSRYAEIIFNKIDKNIELIIFSLFFYVIITLIVYFGIDINLTIYHCYYLPPMTLLFFLFTLLYQRNKKKSDFRFIKAIELKQFFDYLIQYQASLKDTLDSTNNNNFRKIIKKSISIYNSLDIVLHTQLNYLTYIEEDHFKKVKNSIYDLCTISNHYKNVNEINDYDITSFLKSPANISYLKSEMSICSNELKDLITFLKI